MPTYATQNTVWSRIEVPEDLPLQDLEQVFALDPYPKANAGAISRAKSKSPGVISVLDISQCAIRSSAVPDI